MGEFPSVCWGPGPHGGGSLYGLGGGGARRGWLGGLETWGSEAKEAGARGDGIDGTDKRMDRWTDGRMDRLTD